MKKCEGYEDYVNNKNLPISPVHFEEVLAAAINILPNNNILNIISKANEPEHKHQVLDLFKTDQKVEFTYDDKSLNFLSMLSMTGIGVDMKRNTGIRLWGST